MISVECRAVNITGDALALTVLIVEGRGLGLGRKPDQVIIQISKKM